MGSGNSPWCALVGDDEMSRYNQLTAWCAKHKPTVIVEVGAHKGERAEAMIRAAKHKFGHYLGFDLWEAGDAVTDATEYNGKGRSEKAETEKRLAKTNWSITLTQGNTRETLKNFDAPYDVAFIDGGHSVETIESDWDNIHERMNWTGATFLDDFYNKSVDTSRFGCNRLVESLEKDPAFRVTKLPVIDGHTQMIKVEWSK